MNPNNNQLLTFSQYVAARCRVQLIDKNDDDFDLGGIMSQQGSFFHGVQEWGQTRGSGSGPVDSSLDSGHAYGYGRASLSQELGTQYIGRWIDTCLYIKSGVFFSPFLLVFVVLPTYLVIQVLHLFIHVEQARGFIFELKNEERKINRFVKGKYLHRIFCL